jgi:hypothetical protein
VAGGLVIWLLVFALAVLVFWLLELALGGTDAR